MSCKCIPVCVEGPGFAHRRASGGDQTRERGESAPISGCSSWTCVAAGPSAQTTAATEIIRDSKKSPHDTLFFKKKAWLWKFQMCPKEFSNTHTHKIIHVNTIFRLNVRAKYCNKPAKQPIVLHLKPIYSLPGHMGSEQSAVPALTVSALWGRRLFLHITIHIMYGYLQSMILIHLCGSFCLCDLAEQRCKGEFLYACPGQ